MNKLEKFRLINTFILDVDGVLTNSHLVVLEDGKVLRKFNTRDGFAMRTAIEKGYRIAIITGGKSTGVELRLRDMGIVDIFSGIRTKIDAYEELVHTYELDESKILYMGDDIPDVPVMKRVGMPCCPADASFEAKDVSRYVSLEKGGFGCVRDVIQKVLTLQGNWPAH